METCGNHVSERVYFGVQSQYLAKAWEPWFLLLGCKSGFPGSIMTEVNGSKINKSHVPLFMVPTKCLSIYWPSLAPAFPPECGDRWQLHRFSLRQKLHSYKSQHVLTVPPEYKKVPQTTSECLSLSRLLKLLLQHILSHYHWRTWERYWGISFLWVSKNYHTMIVSRLSIVQLATFGWWLYGIILYKNTLNPSYIII